MGLPLERYCSCLSSHCFRAFKIAGLSHLGAAACSELWRIIDVAEDLSWAVFYYAGAASAAGITYRGALICTPTGELPEGAEANGRVDAALAACGIRRWEMFAVDNSQCADAPLSTPDSADLTLRALAPVV